MSETPADAPAAGQEVRITPPAAEEIDAEEAQGEGKPAKIPTALEEFRAQYGLPDVFSLVVKKANPRKGGKEEQVMEYTSKVPTTEELAEWHGVGDFYLYPSWRDAKGKLHQVKPALHIPISGDYYENLYDEARIKRNRSYAGRANGTGTPAPGGEDLVKQLRETLALAKEMRPETQPLNLQPLADAIKEQGANFREMIKDMRAAQVAPAMNPFTKALLDALAVPLAALAVDVAKRALIPGDGTKKDPLDELLNKGEKLKAISNLFGGGESKEDHWVDKIADRLERLMLSWEKKGGGTLDDDTKEMIKEHPDFQKLLSSPDLQNRVWDKFFRHKKFPDDLAKLRGCKNALVIMRELDVPVPAEFEQEYEELKKKVPAQQAQ